MVVSLCVDKMKVRNETRKTWKPDQTAETIHPKTAHINNWERYNIEHLITFFTSQETKTIGKLKLQEHGDYLTAEKNKLQAEMIGRCLAWVSGLALKRCKPRSHDKICDQRRCESWQELWHHTPAVVHILGTHAHALSVVYVLFTDLFINALQFVLIYSSPYNKLKTCFYFKLDLYFYKPCLFFKFSFNVSYFII